MAATAGHRPAPDDGFTMVEVIVAIAIFTVVSIATIGVLLNAISTGTANADRVFAANVARSQTDYFRTLGSSAAQQAIAATPTVSVTNPSNSTTYTVTRTATWNTYGTSNSCFASLDPSKAALDVYVTVTGGKLKAAQTNRTLIYTASTTSATQGSVSVYAYNSTGVAVSGASVSLTRSGQTTVSGTTSAQGCYFAPTVLAGTWTLSVTSGSSTVTRQVGVVANSNSYQAVQL